MTDVTRLLAARPESFDLVQLRAAAAAAAPGCLDVNEVAPDRLAAYWPADMAPDLSVWEQVVAGTGGTVGGAGSTTDRGT